MWNVPFPVNNTQYGELMIPVLSGSEPDDDNRYDEEETE